MSDLYSILFESDDASIKEWLSNGANFSTLTNLNWITLLEKRPSIVRDSVLLGKLSTSLLAVLIMNDPYLLSSGLVTYRDINDAQLNDVLIRHPSLITAIPDTLILHLPSLTMLTVLLESHEWCNSFSNMRLKSKGLMHIAEHKPEYISRLSIGHLTDESIMAVVLRHPDYINHSFPKSLMTFENAVKVVQAHPSRCEYIADRFDYNPIELSIESSKYISSCKRDIVEMVLENSNNLEDVRVTRLMDSITLKTILMEKPALAYIAPLELLISNDICELLIEHPSMVHDLPINNLSAIDLIRLLQSSSNSMSVVSDEWIISKLVLELVRIAPDRFHNQCDILVTDESHIIEAVDLLAMIQMPLITESDT